MEDLYFAITIIDIIISLIIFTTTIIGLIYIIKEQKFNTLPKKINLECKNCKSNNLSINTLKINPYNKAQQFIKANIYICLISFAINLLITILLLFESDEMFNFLFEKGNFISDGSHFITTILINSVIIKFQAIIFSFNIIMHFIASLIKKDAIITVCKDCGYVTSYFE